MKKLTHQRLQPSHQTLNLTALLHILKVKPRFSYLSDTIMCRKRVLGSFLSRAKTEGAQEKQLGRQVMDSAIFNGVYLTYTQIEMDENDLHNSAPSEFTTTRPPATLLLCFCPRQRQLSFALFVYPDILRPNSPVLSTAYKKVHSQSYCNVLIGPIITVF